MKTTEDDANPLALTVAKFTKQAARLSRKLSASGSSSAAIQAHLVTPQDLILSTPDGSRLPGVPLLSGANAHASGRLEVTECRQDEPNCIKTESPSDDMPEHIVHVPPWQNGRILQKSAENSLRKSMPPSQTHPLFPPLPLYGPPSLLRTAQCLFYRLSSFSLSLLFLGVIVAGSLVSSVPTVCRRMWLLAGDRQRPFYEEEMRRSEIRRHARKNWERRASGGFLVQDDEETADEYSPTEGGKDPIVCDVSYYARRVGLDAETFLVQTEDGFILELWHIYDPKEYAPRDEKTRAPRDPSATAMPKRQPEVAEKGRRFPVLLMHGLLQSSGAYCCNDDESLAFWLCKSGFDVWLGNNRCGFRPRHQTLDYGDPRMWCWNIRQMGILDLPALTGRVLAETGFAKIGLICHSQGTTQTLVALAKEQRPELGDRLTVFCALAPAAYAGPLIGKIYFEFMRVISPPVFRAVFGIHAFIPFMMQMHRLLPPRLYGWMGYKVFSYLFDWSDARWDRELRDRMFQFAPVYVSAESMRWWLGRECFAKHKCILATQETTRAEDQMSEDEVEAAAWYDEHAPPFALWVCGNDDLVDGKRLLRRFEQGREPHVRVVHSKVVDEYEHLDVIWAMDAVDQVFKEVREVLWKTCDARDVCRVPAGCEAIDVSEGKKGETWSV
ncbi:hypothetical protein XA68_16380 [Ophiocordyceps unilateralis]|uniref:Partial AB-hydrolase lipase domain-containing protein n=1 Tax=Ophiocordyceps unilateralis TaxID=268505 RepID=A0A2A9PLJ9_OPHUN|nr:hypothetical protein XA68_16380 [Ophiocordyceps unilateralis]